MSESSESDNFKFSRRGKMALHALKPGVEDSRFTLSEAAVATERANTLENLYKNFIQIPLLYAKRVSDQGTVEIIEPTSPYGYGAVMVVAVDESVVNFRPDESDGTQKIPAKNIFAYSSETQVEYYRQILACIQAQENTQFPDEKAANEKFTVIGFENTTVDVSNREHRIPRSIALPHMHVAKMGNWFDTEYKTTSKYGFRAEQKILQNETWFDEFRLQLLDVLRSTSGVSPDEITVTMRNAVPFGYTISLHAGHDAPIGVQAAILSEILSKHNLLYTEFAEDQIAKVDSHRSGHGRSTIRSKIVPQPSYRTYLYYREGNLCATISPEFMTPVGAVETLGIKVHRNPENTKPYSAEEMGLFMNKVKSSITSILDGEKITTPSNSNES